MISNRGHVWGSGGFWRMPARPGAAPREIRYEETTWKARPDWSRDGRRVVYSSYLGRQWHQLWLMTADGGDPLPAHLRRVRRHGAALVARRTAHRLHLERGRQHVALDRRRAGRQRRTGCAPSGESIARPSDGSRLSGDRRAQRAAVAGASLGHRPDGRSWAPDDAWRHARRRLRPARADVRVRLLPHVPGGLADRCPAGEYAVEVSRGPEYRVERRTVEIATQGRTTAVRVALRPLGRSRRPGLVQRRPARPHELRRRLPQRPRAGSRSRRGRRI